jgi:hypothetical protein
MQSIALRALYDTLEGVQKLRISAENRLRAITQQYDEGHPERVIAIQHVKDIEKFENYVSSEAEKLLRENQIYKEFLSKINGIAVRTSLRLLALGLDINRELSDWYAYFGIVPIYWACECEHGHKILLPSNPFTTGATCIMRVKDKETEDTVEDINGEVTKVKRVTMKKCGGRIIKAEEKPPRRIDGYFSFWNKRAKKTYYIITDYWVKNPDKSFYGRIFKQEREKLMQRPNAEGVYYKIVDKDGKLVKVPSRKATLSARRKAFKIFLAHLYQAWREILGMGYRMPYAFEFLGHDDFVDWKTVIGIEAQLRAKKVA